MRIWARLVEKLKSSEPEPEFIGASQTSRPALSDTDIEVLRALRLIHRASPTHSFSLKLYPGKVDVASGRIFCQYCLMKRCRDYEPRVVLVHHSKRGLELYGCGPCKDFLIRTVNQESNQAFQGFSQSAALPQES